MNVYVQDTDAFYGPDRYNSQFNRPAGRGSSNQYNLADFTLGPRTQYELATVIVAHLRQRTCYGYVQDDWKSTQRLTLNMGVRYEFVTPYYEDQNWLSNFGPAPRFGCAFRLANRTVLRGGYGIGYVYFNCLSSANLLATNEPAGDVRHHDPEHHRRGERQRPPTAPVQRLAGHCEAK